MKIVVPTDLSDFSKIAFKYAIRLAKEIKAEILLLHVISEYGMTKARISTDMLNREIKKSDEQDILTMIHEVDTEGVQVNYKIIHGPDVQNLIDNFCKETNADIIIMGSRGASGLKKIILGSTTVAVINHTTTPVIIIPESIVFAPLKKILYATDLQHIEHELNIILPLADKLAATIKMLHVSTGEHELINIIELKAKWDYRTNYPMDLETIEGDDIAESIEKYAIDSDADLLAMFTHKTSFFNSFLDKSYSREIAFHNKIPMLVINNG